MVVVVVGPKPKRISRNLSNSWSIAQGMDKENIRRGTVLMHGPPLLKKIKEKEKATPALDRRHRSRLLLLLLPLVLGLFLHPLSPQLSRLLVLRRLLRSYLDHRLELHVDNDTDEPPPKAADARAADRAKRCERRSR